MFEASAILRGLEQPRVPMAVVQCPRTGRRGLGVEGRLESSGWPVLASLPPAFPEWLGDRSFQEVHGTRFPYVVGAMANGIATVSMVVAAARAGFLGFFGAAGLGLPRVQEAVEQLRTQLQSAPFGSNLIHSPHEPELEHAVVELYLKAGVRRVSASAFMDLSPALVWYACSGLHQAPDGSIQRTNHVFAKISRPEVAARFVHPAPRSMLDDLQARGLLSPEEARLAAHVPIAEDITVESDSGGHTDNQSLGALFPTIAHVRDQAVQTHGYTRPIRLGAAGGIGTPTSAASAFGLGAAYVLTGSINQACVESGLAVQARKLLANAGLADTTMAPAADMFEMGVEVQVLKRGTLFAQRGHLLRTLYRKYEALEAIPLAERRQIEKSCFRESIDEAWSRTAAYWQARDQAELQRAERDPKHKMALLFRAYLGQASRWAIDGKADRSLDYQIWCGPAMGAFNTWAQGSFLEQQENRTVEQVGLNLLEGAAVITRAHQLRSLGLSVPAQAFAFAPRPLSTQSASESE